MSETTKPAYWKETTVRTMTLRIVSACNVSSSGDYFVDVKYWRTAGGTAGGRYATTRTYHLNSDCFMTLGPEPAFWKGAPAYLLKAAWQLIAEAVRAGLPFYEHTREGGKRVTTYPSESQEMRYYSNEFVERWLK